MVFISLLVFAIALIHVIWARRIWWPIRDQAALTRAVTGFKGQVEMPPPAACYAVAGLLSLVAIWPYFPGGWFHQLGLLGIAMVFLSRGAIGLISAFDRIWPEEPFVRLNRVIYSPLCLLIGTAYFLRLITFGEG